MKTWKRAALILSISILLSGCSGNTAVGNPRSLSETDGVQIGLSWDTFVLERWLRDRDVFVSTASDLGAEVNVQNAMLMQRP